MKMKNMIAVLSAMAVSAVGMSAMTFSASAADELGQAYLIGTFGTEQNWNAGDNAGVNVVSVDGDAQYELTWDLAAATNTGNSWFLSVVVYPTSVDNFTTDTFENLAVTLDEVWVDGVQIEDLSTAYINAAFYEGGDKPGVTRIFLNDDWTGTGANVIDDRDITSQVKVLFTVSGTGAEGTSNVVTETPEESQPEESSTPEEESSVAEDSSSTADSSSAADSSSTTSSTTSTTSSTTSTTTTTNTNTGDAGVAALVAAVAAAGAAVVVTAKKNK